VGFSHALITRPQPQGDELAALLAPLGIECVTQPAFEYVSVDASVGQPDACAALRAAGPADLVLFTSPRAVSHGLPQIPTASLGRARVGAIGPATARALQAAGIRVSLRAANGYTSEALLETLSGESAPAAGSSAFIIAAPGGRTTLAESLEAQGRAVHTLMVYRAEPAMIDRAALDRLERANGILSVWTSANAMNALSQRLPPATWFRICQGDWLVISDRLHRLARAYGPPRIHLAGGPGNDAIATAVRALL
jgi:uroporphyrinogen-III synthase